MGGGEFTPATMGQTMTENTDPEIDAIMKSYPEHELSADCWCEPELVYVDPETGDRVYAHRMVQ